IALVACKTEETLFENGILAVPERDGEAHVLAAVADAAEPVLIPAICARAGVIVREVFPRRAVGGVVLADRAPAALREIRPPALPMLFSAVGFGESPALGSHLLYVRHPKVPVANSDLLEAKLRQIAFEDTDESKVRQV